MRRNGFTLIELLAVIVILAIIVLIAVPIVLNIIEDSKKSSQKESINMYGKAVEDAVANYLLINPNDKDITFDKIKDYINYSGEKVECTDSKIYPNGKIYLGKCSVGGTEVTYTYGEKEKTLCTLSEDTGETGLSRGDKYTCEVIKGIEEPYTFYVLGTEGEGTNQKVNLIMNQNICTDGTLPTSTNTCLIAWYASSDDSSNGPVTAMEELYNTTKNWTNVPDLNLDYSDEGHIVNTSYGYGKIEATEAGIKITKKDGTTEVTGTNNQTPVIPYEAGKQLKARLPKLEEVYNTGTDANYCHDSVGSCPAWLTNGLAQYSTYYPDNEHIAGIYGYWLLSSNPGNSYYARHVYYIGDGSNSSTSVASGYGLRAVITVSMSDLS